MAVLRLFTPEHRAGCDRETPGGALPGRPSALEHFAFEARPVSMRPSDEKYGFRHKPRHLAGLAPSRQQGSFQGEVALIRGFGQSGPGLSLREL